MENRDKKILRFPSREEPVPAKAIFQIDSARFAIHICIESLPPVEPLLRLVPRAKKTTKPIRPRDSKSRLSPPSANGAPPIQREPAECRRTGLRHAARHR